MVWAVKKNRTLVLKRDGISLNLNILVYNAVKMVPIQLIKSSAVIMVMLILCFQQANAQHFSTDSVEFFIQKRKFDAAEKLNKQFMERLQSQKQTYTNEYASALMFQGVILENQNKIEEAEKAFLQAISLLKDISKQENADLAKAYIKVGFFYNVQAYFGNAEYHLIKGIELGNRTFEPGEKILIQAHNCIAWVYSQLNNVEKSVFHSKEAALLAKKYLGEKDYEYEGALNNLCNNYFKISPDSSLKYCKKCLEYRKQKYGLNNGNTGLGYNNMAVKLIELGQFSRAGLYLDSCITIYEKKLPSKHKNFEWAYINKSNIASETGNYQQHLKFLKLAVDIINHNYGLNTQFSWVSRFDLGTAYFLADSLQQAYTTYKRALPKLLEIFEGHVPYLSEKEFEDFYDRYKISFESFKWFALNYQTRAPIVRGDWYNFAIRYKGLLLNNSGKWRKMLKNSGDTRLLLKYQEWEDLKLEIESLKSLGSSKVDRKIDSLNMVSEVIEKELRGRSELFAKATEKKVVDWKEIQAKLKPGEAALEMLRVMKFGHSKVFIDSSGPERKLYKPVSQVDTFQYVALIIKPGLQHPEIVMIKNGNELEGPLLAKYRFSIRYRVEETNSYGSYWADIQRKLSGVKKLYFSPDGVYHLINLNTLLNPKTRKYVMDEIDIQLTTSTRFLLEKGVSDDLNQTAILVGNPDFKLRLSPTKSLKQKSQLLAENSGKVRSFNPVELPGTHEEVKKIAEFLDGKGWQIQVFEQNLATLEKLRNIFKPKVLHIATHGFFVDTSTKNNNAMLNSGLLLAGSGSNSTFENSSNEGILTARTAMNLNLDNTDLVVLSACETGLGKLANGEGVFGLQRAFKIAGAKTLVMSLWKVADNQTQELMVAFYRNWVAGLGKRQAFFKAQKEIKAKYPDPYFWGAFVMVGE